MDAAVSACLLFIPQYGGVQDVRAHAQLMRHFLRYGQLVAGDHFDFHAHLHGARDGRLGLFARRIGHGQDPNELPFVVLICSGHTQRAEAACRKFIDGFLNRGFYFRDIGRHLQNDLRRSLRHLELFSVGTLYGGFGALVDRIERLEMKDLIALQFFIVLHTADHGQIDRVLVLRARSESGVEDDLIGSNTIDTEWIAQRELVLGQSSGLIRAQHIHAREFLDRRQLSHNRLLFGQETRPDRHRDGEHRRHRYWDRGH